MTNPEPRYGLVGAEMVDVTDLSVDRRQSTSSVPQIDDGDPTGVGPLYGMDYLDEIWARVSVAPHIDRLGAIAHRAGELVHVPGALARSLGGFVTSQMHRAPASTRSAGRQEGTGIRAGMGQTRY